MVGVKQDHAPSKILSLQEIFFLVSVEFYGDLNVVRDKSGLHQFLTVARFYIVVTFIYPHPVYTGLTIQSTNLSMFIQHSSTQ